MSSPAMKNPQVTLDRQPIGAAAADIPRAALSNLRAKLHSLREISRVRCGRALDRGMLGVDDGWTDVCSNACGGTVMDTQEEVIRVKLALDRGYRFVATYPDLPSA